MSGHVIPFENLRNSDVSSVGGKNASLGEMISQLSAKGVRVPTGFATTADAYREFLAQNGLDTKINAELDKLNVDDTQALAICGKQVREWTYTDQKIVLKAQSSDSNVLGRSHF